MEHAQLFVTFLSLSLFFFFSTFENLSRIHHNMLCVCETVFNCALPPLQVARTVDFQEGEVIIRKGDVGHTFFIVLEGVVNCSDASLVDKGDDDDVSLDNRPARGLPVASAPDGGGLTPREMMRQATLPAGGVRLKAGDWFGEIALLTGSVRTANVVADSSVRLLAFDRTAFEKVLGNLKDIIDRKANHRMLAILPVIANLPPKRREAAVDMFSVESFSDGSTIAAAGDPNPRFILIKSGKAVVFKPAMVAKDTSTTPKFLNFPTSLPTSSANESPRKSPASPGGSRLGNGARVVPTSQLEESTTATAAAATKSNTRSIPASFESSFESLSSFEV
jgi:CRP-like cAMP-binding protein